MGDRPGSSARVRTSEDKVRRKDLCWSVRAVYVLEKLPDVSGPGLGEAGRYSDQKQKHLWCWTRSKMQKSEVNNSSPF